MNTRQFSRLIVMLLIAALMVSVLAVTAPVDAQTNLLNNPDFEQNHGDGVNLTAPRLGRAWQ
jgi:hypothetical protein